MEGWTEIMIYLIKIFHVAVILYFVILVFVGSFFLMNLTLAVIKVKFSEFYEIDEKAEKARKVGIIDIEISLMKILKKMERKYLRKNYLEDES